MVTQDTSAAVDAILKDPNIIENPTLADFEALEPGDILVSSRIGSQREVLINNPTKKELAVRVTRDSALALMGLPPFYRTDTDQTPMSKDELVKLSPDSKVFMRDNGEYSEVVLHSVKPGATYTEKLTGVYSFDEVRSYKTDKDRELATKIRKKKQES